MARGRKTVGFPLPRIYTARVQTSPWKQIGIALATLAGLSISAALLWALYGNALVPPERMLPSDTAALVTNADAMYLRVLKGWIPALAALPEASREQIGALIPVEGSPNPLLLTPNRSLSSHPYDVQAAPDTQARVGSPERRLEDDASYVALLAEKRPETAWAYVHPGHMGSGALLSPWKWLSLSRPFSLSLGDATLQAAMIDEAPSGLPSLSASIPSVFTRPVLTVQGSDLLALWERLSSALSPDVRFTLRSLGTEAVRKRVGDDVSLTYDLAPLFKGESALYVGLEGPDAKTRFLAEGTLERAAEERMRMIVDSFRSYLPSIKRETLTFEQGFVSDTIAEDESAVETQKLSVEGWEINTVHHKESNRVLVVALKGEKFLVSDSPAAVEARVRHTLPSISLSGINGSLLAAGIVQRKDAGALGSATLGKAWETQAALPEAFGDTMSWSISKERGRLVFRLENLQKAL
jgi:hypothetical protein